MRALFWRKDIFQDAGLDPEKPPKNWDELIEYARRIADPARDKYGISMAGGAQSSWDFMSYLWSAGADAVTQDKKTGEWRAAFGTREAAVALDFYMRLATERWQDSDGTVQHGYSTLNSDERSVKLAQQAGKLGMYSQYLGDDRMGGEVDPALVGIAPFPAGPSGRGATEINATLNGIFAGIDGHNAGLVQDHALALLCDDDGGCTKIDPDIILCHNPNVPFSIHETAYLDESSG